MTDSAKAPSKGAAMLVTNGQLNADFDRMAETALRIKREHGQMADLLRLWLHNYNANLGVIGEMQAATERLLTELEGKL